MGMEVTMKADRSMGYVVCGVFAVSPCSRIGVTSHPPRGKAITTSISCPMLPAIQWWKYGKETR